MKRFYSWVVSIMNPMDLFDLYIFFSIPQFRFGSWIDLNIITFVTHPVYCLLFVLE